MPSGLIDEKDGMGSRCDGVGDFGQMQVHLQAGRIKAAPFPCFGQMAPKM